MTSAPTCGWPATSGMRQSVRSAMSLMIGSAAVAVDAGEVPDDRRRELEADGACGFDRQRLVIGDAGAGQDPSSVWDDGTRSAQPLRRLRRRPRAATPRAVVYLTPTTVIAPGGAVGGVIENLRRAEQLGAACRDRAPAGTRPRWTSVMSSRVRCRAGNAAFASATNASISARSTSPVSAAA